MPIHSPTDSPIMGILLAGGDEVDESWVEIVDLVTNKCGREMNACFDDGVCGHLFMIGSVSLSSKHLQELLECIEAFDEDGNSFQAFRGGGVGVDAKQVAQGLCVANECRTLYLQCQLSADCFLGVGAAAAQLDACVAAQCVSTGTPTMAPTARPSIFDDAEATGLLFEIDGDATFKVDFKQITAGDLHTIPIGGAASALEGHVVIATSCDLASDGTDVVGAFVVVKQNCNVYDMTRVAASRGAIVVAFAIDVTATHQWVPRDRMLSLPVLSLGYDVAVSAQTMIRRGKQVRGRLSSRGYCDLMHASDLDTSSIQGSVGGDSCCVAGDVITSYLLQEYSFWNIGVRD
jgi:hypothetical protein